MILRLKAVRKALGMNQTEFAKQLGLKQTSYSMIESQNRPLAKKYIKLICSIFNVSESWILSGDGEMFLSSPYEAEFREIFGQLTPVTQGYLVLMARELLGVQKKLLAPDEGE